MFGVARRVVRDTSLAEEVTQEVFVEIWRSAPHYDASRGSAATWVVTIARRRAVDRVRSEQSQRLRIETFGLRANDPDGDVAEAVNDSLDAERVRRALAELPDQQRAVIQLAFVDGWTHHEIAAHLGLPLGTVKGRVRSGLRRLRLVIGDTR